MSCVNVPACLQAVDCYTQALSEAGGQNQRAACSALSYLQVSGLYTHTGSDFFSLSSTTSHMYVKEELQVSVTIPSVFTGCVKGSHPSLTLM